MALPVDTLVIKQKNECANQGDVKKRKAQKLNHQIKKKYVIAETLDDFELEPGSTIQMIVGSPGSQLFEVEDEFSQRALASLPQKFRKTIWLKRKDFVVCMPIFEGNKVKYEITR